MQIAGSGIVVWLVLSIPAYQPEETYPGRVMAQAQSFYGDLKVIKAGPNKCLAVNAAIQSCIDNNMEAGASQFRMAKKFIQKRKPQNVLLLGLGGGSIISVIPEQTAVDIVDFDAKSVEFAKENGLIPDRQYNIFYDDARHFI